MKNIAIFCDGTWQDFGQPYPTNVARLARATTQRDADGGVQVIRYDDGVGVGQGAWDKVTKIAGGAFGNGLDYKIVRSYEFLCLNYEPGDRLFLFGFSRGAYTVRSLAGLLRHLWILRPGEGDRVLDAIRLYRQRPRDGAPKAAEDAWQAEVAAFRKQHCWPDMQAFTGDKVYDPDDPASLTPQDPKSCAWIQYLGVWDTVGSLGIPAKIPFAKVVDQPYAFHDTRLSRFVRSARHAVSLDERRETFTPTLWPEDNLAELNQNAGAAARSYADQPYQQQWFPGGHGAVGGGGESAISYAPLLWIAEGAARAGLSFDPAQIEAFKGKVDPAAAFDKGAGFDVGGFIMRLVGTKWRTGPTVLDQIALSSKLRVKTVSGYAPGALTAATLQQLSAFQAPDPCVWYSCTCEAVAPRRAAE